MVNEVTVGSLFSGIGGMDLGLERAGMRVIWQSEIDPFASKVLKKHWKEVPNYGDIRSIKWENVERPTVVCGGYPCQPFSTAGRRKGAEDPRHLWSWFRDAIGILRPQYVLLENVRGHLSLGGVDVLADIASLRYDAEWQVVSAASIGANHKRERLFIVAYAEGSVGRSTESQSLETIFRQTAESGECGCEQGSFSDWWETEPNVDRVADGIPDRVDRLRTLGNAVVPQVAEHIGRFIMRHWHSVQSSATNGGEEDQ